MAAPALDWRAPLPDAPHFTLAELVHSDTAQAYGLDNRPGPAALARLLRLATEVLEPLRRRFGPLAVTSGFRSPELNWFVSLSRTSLHCCGQAADVRPLLRPMRAVDLAAYAYGRLPCHEVILYEPPGGWLHLSQTAQSPSRPRLMLSTAGGLVPLSLAELAQRFGPLLPGEEVAA
ncbi:MAG: D-Ala-D-Ala carboxypeptidase family metallohydrolase [Thermodesulfobacteriota bacterium]